MGLRGSAKQMSRAPSGRDRKTVDDLLAVMAALREPESGCPWDQQQSFASIAPYTIEEAYEVADAVERGRLDELREELGDLLLQVVYHSQMASEIGAFTFADVVDAIVRKMVRRHPHVFAGAKRNSAKELRQSWERIKAEEKAAEGGKGADESALDGVPLALPALARAAKLQTRAAAVGFDWREPTQVTAKVREELAEVQAAAEKGDSQAVAGEVGDALFALVNLARHLKVDPEAALRGANAKFERRFRRIEELLAREKRRPQDVDLAELDRLWEAIKGEEQDP